MLHYPLSLFLSVALHSLNIRFHPSKILLLWMGVFSCVACYSQHSLEELESFIASGKHDTLRVKGFVGLAKLYRNNRPEKAVFYMDQAETLIEQKLAESHQNKNFYLNELTKVYNVSGVIYRRFGNLPEAIRHYKKALKLLETVDNKRVLSSTLYNVGRYHKVKGDLDESVKYFNKSLRLRQKIKDSTGLINCHRELGSIQLERKQYTSALKSYEKGIDIARNVNERKMLELYGYQASVYLELKNFKAVKDSINILQPIFDVTPGKYSKRAGELALHLAKAHYGTGDVRLGIRALKDALDYILDEEAIEEKASIYSLLAVGHQKLGNYQEAIHYLNLKIEQDSMIMATSNTAEVVRIEMGYLFKKEHLADSLKLNDAKEISRLKLDQKNAAIRAGRFRVVGLSIGVVLLAIIGFFVYRNYRLKRKALDVKQKDVESLSLKIKRESEWIDNLMELNDKIKKNQVDNTSEKIQELVNSMRDNLVVDKHRQFQAKNIDVLTNEFREKLKLKYPNLTKTEMEMCELIRLELSNSEISRVRNISQNSARMARYRLKKKLNLSENQTVFEVLKTI